MTATRDLWPFDRGNEPIDISLLNALPTLAAGAMTPEEITRLLLALAVMIGLARILGEVSKRVRLPSIVGEILAGVLLGPTVLAQFSPGGYDWLFPLYGNAYIGLESLITISAVFLLLIAGLEVDMSTAIRQGKATILVSLTGVVIPFAMGFGLGWFSSDMLGLPEMQLVTESGLSPDDVRLPFALFIGIALSITALPVIAKVLMDLNMAKSDVGVLIMASAMVNDLIGWIGFAMVLALIPVTADAAHTAAEADPSGATSVIVWTIALTFAFVIGMLTLGRVLAHRAIPFVQAYGDWPGAMLGFVMVVSLLCAALTEWVGVHSIFGAFIAGVAIGDSSHVHERTRRTIHDFVGNIFAPIFFASIGLRVNFIDAFDLQLVVIVIVIACVGKIGGCWIGAKLAGFGPRESWAVGFGMVARGAMEIILAQLALSAGLIGDRLFVAIVIMAILTSLIAGPAIEKVLKRKQKLSLANLLGEKHIELDLKSENVKDAINELAHIAAKITGLDAKKLADAIWRREQIVHTGLGDGVAVPHARPDGLNKSAVIVGRCNHGIDFDAADGKPARLIFLLLSPPQDESAQIQLLQAVALTAQAAAIRDKLHSAATPTEFRAIINLHEQDTAEH